MKGAGLLALAAVALLCSACAADEQGSPVTQLTTWVKGTGFEASTAQMRSDIAKADALVGHTDDPLQVHTLCGVILIEIQTANDNLPTPDAQLTAVLGSTYTELGEAANDCFDSVGSAAKQQAFAQHRRAGLIGLAEAQLRIEAVTGPNLTATTTQGSGTTSSR